MWFSRIVSIAIVGASLALIGGACGGGSSGSGNSSASCKSSTNPPNVSGNWVLSDPQLLDSDCPEEINSALIDLFSSAGECEYEIIQRGTKVTIANRCGGSAKFVGCVTDEGDVSADWRFATAQQGCKVSTLVNFSDNLVSGGDAVLTAPFKFSRACGISNCTIQIGVLFGMTGTATPPPNSAVSASSQSIVAESAATGADAARQVIGQIVASD